MGMTPPPTLITIFYDGTCGLCHGAVQFLLRRDPDGRRFRYAALQGDTAKKSLAPLTDLPDSIVVIEPDGRVHVEGLAALVIGRRLGGAYALLSAIGGLLPRPLLDSVYRFIARRRYRWFGRKTDVCPLVPETQHGLFLP